MKIRLLSLLSLTSAFSLLPSALVPAAPLGTAFTYQGRLNEGANPASGLYDLRFTIYDSSGGPTVVAGPLTNSPAGVTNGLFTVTLDFGASVFTGAARWLEIGVRTNGGGGFVALVPRQALTPAPYALYAPNAGAAASAGTATTATTATTAATATTASVANAVANNAVTAAGIQAGQVVKSLNGLKDAVTLAAGANLALATNGNTLTLSDAGWGLRGNVGTRPGLDFLGTTDNQPLELRANNVLGLRLPGDGSVEAAGNFSYGGQLNKLDVAPQPAVYLNSYDLFFGHPGRRGSPGRALVDLGSSLALNYAADWPSLALFGEVMVDPYSQNAAGSLRGGLSFGGSSSGEGIASKRSDGGGNAWGLEFYTAHQPRLTIDQYGRVGIGTRAPQKFLEVNGSIKGYYLEIATAISTSSVSPQEVSASLVSATSQLRLYGPRTVLAGFDGTWNHWVGPDPDSDLAFGIHRHGQNDYTLTVKGGVAANTLTTSGDVGIGTATPGARLEVNGNVIVSGTTTTKVLTITGGADVAEPFPMTTLENPKGSVVVIDDEHPGQLKQSQRAYDTRVAGIVSGANGIQPGLSLHQEGAIEGGQHVALTGRVYALADATNGPIKPGDLLTTSDVPGHAMKVTDPTRAQGAVLGKAMTALSEGRGMVLVLVTLQ